MPLTSSTHWLRTAAPGPQGVHTTSVSSTVMPWARRRLARPPLSTSTRCTSPRPCCRLPLLTAMPPAPSTRPLLPIVTLAPADASRRLSMLSSPMRISTTRLRCGNGVAACAAPATRQDSSAAPMAA